MFIAALFTIAKLWKKSRCPTTDEWIKKMWYLYTMEIMSFAGKWTNWRTSSACSYSVLPATFVEEATSSPSYVFDVFVKNQVGVAAWIHICVFYFFPVVFLSVCVPVPYWLFFIAMAL
jgi:hypothetical protein